MGARIFSAINIEGEILNEEFKEIPKPKIGFNAKFEIDLKNLLNAIKGFEFEKLSIENDRLYVDARNEMVKKKVTKLTKIAKISYYLAPRVEGK